MYSFIFTKFRFCRKNIIFDRYGGSIMIELQHLTAKMHYFEYKFNLNRLFELKIIICSTIKNKFKLIFAEKKSIDQ